MLRVMSRRGDDRISWDSKKLEVNDPEAVSAIREAERIFNEERMKGSTAFKVEPGMASSVSIHLIVTPSRLFLFRASSAGEE